MTNSECISVDDLQAYVRGNLPDDYALTIDQHLKICPRCTAVASRQRDPRLDAAKATLPPRDHVPTDTANALTLPPASNGNSNASKTVAGGYELLEELGRGGMGVVYKARQIAVDRTVALKMIQGDQRVSATELQRFRTEATAAARLDHPNIVPLHEVGEQDGRPFFTMKWIDGDSMTRHISRLKSDAPAAIALLATIARAVHHAHQRGIIHRDLKPGNILIDRHGQPHVADFGLARRTEGGSDITQTGMIVGTPSYMAPEQAAGQPHVTTAVDVYSLGAMMYEMLTGRPPFLADSPLNTVLLVIDGKLDPPRAIAPNVDRDLELICLKCLSMAPADRYGSAEALAADLEHWLAGEPVSVRAPNLPKLMHLWLSQNFGAAGWIVVIGLSFGLFGGFIAWMRGGSVLFGSGTAYAYRNLPSVDPPWAMKVLWGTPNWLMSILYFANLVLLSIAGLVTGAMVRPKSRSADIAAGMMTGFVYSVAVLAIAGATLGVALTAVEPVRDDLLTVSKAAWAQPTSESDSPARPAKSGQQSKERLLEKYPDLKKLPEERRGQIVYEKIRVDLIAGIPVGIWMVALFIVTYSMLIFTAQLLVAGPILRPHGRRAAVLLPYFERAVPATLLIAMSASFFVAPLLVLRTTLLATFDVRAAMLSFVPILALLALALVAALRRWRRSVRLLAQVGWVLAAIVATAYWSG